MTPQTVPFQGLLNEKISLLNDYFSLTKPRLSSLVIFTSALGMFLAPGEINLLNALIAIVATSGLVVPVLSIAIWKKTLMP